MADISQIQLRGGATYDIKDETARAAIPSNVSDLPNDAGYITGMTILSYGSSTWQDFLDAYNANKVIYCRASSNSNPATGTQGRMAFMAFVEFSSSTPTTVEFQYYRSVSSHSDSQQGDQVFIYKLTNAGVWSVTTRETYTKIAAGAGMSKVYSSGTLTLSSTVAVPSASDATPAALGTASAGSSSDYSRADHVHQKPTYTAADVGALPSSEAHPFILQNNIDYFASTSALPSEAEVGTLAFVEGSSGGGGSGIAIQDTEPSGDELVWIDTDDPGTTRIIPEIDDTSVSSTDTWSSQKIRDFIYPVGSIYMSVNSTSPATIFGGTWEQIQDVFLLSAGSTYTAGNTGGSSTASHTHTLDDNGYAKITAWSTDNKVCYQEKSGRTTWAANYKWGASGLGSDTKESTWGVNLGGVTGAASNTNNMPPYLVVYVWKRTA